MIPITTIMPGIVRNDCVTDDDFEEGPGKGNGGGQLGGNGNRRSGAIGGRGLGSRKSASGRGERSSADGSKSNKNDSKRRRSTAITDAESDYISYHNIISYCV
ncbi:hypothetical protein Bca4012_063979 [Brassica carinata]|uniref:Uncharacterized protein n=1 Tax=Brassica carinata TaxID=52824 RepID=A0A8X7V7E3_BRACI|nr:hypothetical protein Bca52824_033513 [Brassica carinata]